MAYRDLGAVSETLLITLYLRAVDAASARPVLADPYARELVDRIDYDFARLRPFRLGAPFIVARAKRLDDWTRAFVARHPRAAVVQLACGLDSRVFRVDPPRTVAWTDLDLPEVVALRRQAYPRRPGVHTIAASATDDAWWARIPDDRPLLLIAEGLFMYLEPADVENVLRRAVAHAPSGEVCFDGVGAAVVVASRFEPFLRRRGVRFQASLPSAGAMRAWGLQPRQRESIALNAFMVQRATF